MAMNKEIRTTTGQGKLYQNVLETIGNTPVIKLDKFSGISAGVKIFTHSDDYTGKTFYSPFNANSKNDGKRSSIHLKKYVILGTNSLVLPGAKFGEGTVIGAQSVVFKKTDPWTTYFGLPLKKISKRQTKFIKKIRLKKI